MNKVAVPEGRHEGFMVLKSYNVKVKTNMLMKIKPLTELYSFKIIKLFLMAYCSPSLSLISTYLLLDTVNSLVR
jgi:hypothetical protein